MYFHHIIIYAISCPFSGIIVGFEKNYAFSEDAGVVEMCIRMHSDIECSLQSSVVITMEAESNSDGKKNERKPRVYVNDVPFMIIISIAVILVMSFLL